jgi:hypothetical protein
MASDFLHSSNVALSYNRILKYRILKSLFNFRVECVITVNFDVLILMVSSFSMLKYFDF